MKRSLLPFAVTALLASFAIVGCSGCSGNSGEGHYTYNTYLATNPKTWNTHNWESNDESYIPAFTEMGLYDLQLNSTKDGYEIITEMAAAMPVDVTETLTEEEMTKYGYTGNPDKGFVWEIALNEKAVWEDGKAINADTYVESMKRQLDPKMVNFRADSYYASGFVIANAERYFKQGRKTIEPAFNYIKDDGTYTSENFCQDGFWYLNLKKASPYPASVFSGTSGDEGFYVVLNNRTSSGSDALELAAQRITDGANWFAWKYCDHAGDYADKWEEVKEVKDLSKVTDDMINYDMNLDDFDNKSVYVRKTKDVAIHSEDEGELYTQEKLKADIKTVVTELAKSATGKFNPVWNWKLPLFSTYFNDYKEDFGNVGIAKTGDYKIKLFLSQAVTELDLKFSLSSSWIVDVELYDSLKVTTAAGLVSTKYATPGGGLEGYKSYGPYKLTKYEDGKSFLIEKNDKWYGYTDGKHKGQYQMDAIYTRIITDHNTALQEFEKGNLDDFDLNRTDMKTYGNSSRLTQTYESYTQKISFNSDRAKLASRQKESGQNKTILANKNFREGLSLAIDRNLFASQTTAGSKGFTGLLNDLYLTDVEKGEMYRGTSAGKKVYSSVYGELGGDPYSPEYAPAALDEKSNGFNLNMATKFVADAFQEEIESTDDKHLLANDNIAIEFRVYDNESETTIDMLNFLREAFKEVVSRANAKAGTNITISIEAVKDEDYYNTAKNGNYDCIFSTWGGAAINPQGLMQVYCDSTFDSCCEYGFKGHQSDVLLDIDSDGDGVVETKSFNTWYTEVNELVLDKEAPDYELRHTKLLNILAGLEAGILNRFEAVPLVARASSSINSFKIENGSPTYINLIGYGGVRHMTFNYDDAQWAKFVEEHPNLKDLYKS